MSSLEERRAAKDTCVRRGLIAGGKGALSGFLGGAAVVGAANHFSSGFRSSLGVSGKTALVVSALVECADSQGAPILNAATDERSKVRCVVQVSPAFLLYFLLSELAVNECARQQRHRHNPGLPGDILQQRRG